MPVGFVVLNPFLLDCKDLIRLSYILTSWSASFSYLEHNREKGGDGFEGQGGGDGVEGQG